MDELARVHKLESTCCRLEPWGRTTAWRFEPMFRSVYKKRRCIIPASGFYEWTGKADDKTPHLFTAGDGMPVLAFTGLWESWRDLFEGEDVLSCTIIVSGASDWMTTYHDRMPVLLEAE